MQQCDCRDLLVERMLGMRHPQPPPELSGLRVQHQDPIAVGLQEHSQPLLQCIGLSRIASAADQIHATAQFTDGDRRQIQRLVLVADRAEEGPHPRISP